MTFQTNFKAPKGTVRKSWRSLKRKRKQAETAEMQAVRERDKVCRFPLCGCQRLGFKTEVSHDRHRGLGGNPSGDRTTTQSMVLLCHWRHQAGRVSRHAGTLRAIPVDAALGYDGPVIWQVHPDGLPEPEWRAHVIRNNEGWLTVALEIAPGHIARSYPWQLLILKRLQEMDV
mgnify:CR=1 FL=1